MGECMGAGLGVQLEPVDAECPSQVLSVSHHLLLSSVLPSPAADEMFSFKYSPGKLRGNQYKSMMTKEELEEEQRYAEFPFFPSHLSPSGWQFLEARSHTITNTITWIEEIQGHSDSLQLGKLLWMLRPDVSRVQVGVYPWTHWHHVDFHPLRL